MAADRRPHVQCGEARIDVGAGLRQRALPLGARPAASMRAAPTGHRGPGAHRATPGSRRARVVVLSPKPAAPCSVKPSRSSCSACAPSVRRQRGAGHVEPPAGLQAERGVAVGVVASTANPSAPSRISRCSQRCIRPEREAAQQVIVAVLPLRVELAFELAVALAVAAQIVPRECLRSARTRRRASSDRRVGGPGRASSRVPSTPNRASARCPPRLAAQAPHCDPMARPASVSSARFQRVPVALDRHHRERGVGAVQLARQAGQRLLGGRGGRRALERAGGIQERKRRRTGSAPSPRRCPHRSGGTRSRPAARSIPTSRRQPIDLRRRGDVEAADVEPDAGRVVAQRWPSRNTPGPLAQRVEATAQRRAHADSTVSLRRAGVTGWRRRCT